MHRKESELLKILLENIHLMDRFGLCRVSNQCERKFLLSENELIICKAFIISNRPNPIFSLETWKQRNDTYYWDPGHKEPRIKWLKKHIKRLEKKGR